ncbi:MAG: family hydrolase [Candidatus Adlerbacteria bacterium]|nr:family hydrolase [Candidatus Adlerbacteria bacterium]
MKPKVIIFDLDGTLAESKQRVSAEVGDLLSQLLQKHMVAIMSGATFGQFETQLLPSISDAPLEHLYLFAVNGGQCFVYKNGTWNPQYDHSFSAAESANIKEQITKVLPQIGFEMPPQLWGEQIEDRGAQITFSALGQQAPLAEKEAWAQAHGTVRKQLRDALAAALPGCTVEMGGITSVDVTPKGIDKSFGIKRLVELTQIPVSDMLYIGDALEEGGNDSVVIATGVATHEVFSIAETTGIIERIIAL